ncbi:unnamed protein product, partial [Oppiella nova]
MLKVVIISLAIILASASSPYKDCDQDTTKLTFGMTVDLGSGPVDITKYMPDFDNNGCHLVKCPVKKGDPLSIVYKAVIPKLAPTDIEGNMTVTMKGEQGDLFCFSIREI